MDFRAFYKKKSYFFKKSPTWFWRTNKAEIFTFTSWASVWVSAAIRPGQISLETGCFCALCCSSIQRATLNTLTRTLREFWNDTSPRLSSRLPKLAWTLHQENKRFCFIWLVWLQDAKPILTQAEFWERHTIVNRAVVPLRSKFLGLKGHSDYRLQGSSGLGFRMLKLYSRKIFPS